MTDIVCKVYIIRHTRLLAHVIDYYHETLKQSPEALDYLEKRGIANAQAIDRFKLGFANRTLAIWSSTLATDFPMGVSQIAKYPGVLQPQT